MEVDDIVRIKTVQEIKESKSNLYFNPKMERYCGGEFVIKKFVTPAAEGVRGATLNDINEPRTGVDDWIWDIDKWLTPAKNTNIHVTDTDLMELLNEQKQS